MMTEGEKFCPGCGAPAIPISPFTARPGLAGALPSLPPRYPVLRFLGRGGMGRVFLCQDAELDVEVAVKVLPVELASDADALEQVRREARAAAKIRGCPGILALYGFERHGDTSFLVMEYAAGGSLSDRLRREGALPEEECRRLGAGIADALGFAHGKKVLHRDVKPANVLLDGDGLPKVADFGLAKVLADASSRLSLSAVAGTPAYMAPETLLRRKVDGRADLHSLGCLLYEIATGRLPFEGSIPEVALAKASPGAEAPDPRELRPDLSEGFAAAVRTLLAPDPEARFPDAASCAAALREAGPIPAAPPAAATDAPASTEGELGTVVADPFLGARISDCDLLEKIGEGSSGAVYRARDARLHRVVAMKVLFPWFARDQAAVDRFVKEAISAAQLNHPNIVAIHKIGKDVERDVHYVIQEMPEGRTLAERVVEDGPFSPSDAVGVALQVCSALAAAHDRGLVHGNLKPENILVDSRNGAKVTDFALTRASPSSRLAGKYASCIAPEQVEGGAVDPRTDIYALGVTLYYALAGESPFDDGSAFGHFQAILAGTPIPLEAKRPGLPAPVLAAVRRMMARRPEDRFATCLEARRALLEWRP